MRASSSSSGGGRRTRVSTTERACARRCSAELGASELMR